MKRRDFLKFVGYFPAAAGVIGFLGLPMVDNLVILNRMIEQWGSERLAVFSVAF